jgi:hypothetical protein
VREREREREKEKNWWGWRIWCQTRCVKTNETERGWERQADKHKNRQIDKLRKEIVRNIGIRKSQILVSKGNTKRWMEKEEYKHGRDTLKPEEHVRCKRRIEILLRKTTIVMRNTIRTN